VNPGETHAGGVRGEIGGSATGLARQGQWIACTLYYLPAALCLWQRCICLGANRLRQVRFFTQFFIDRSYLPVLVSDPCQAKIQP
jgi:hypothetical protein